MIQLNIPEFKTFIKKATFNNSIENIKIVATPSEIRSSIVGLNVVCSLIKENNVLLGLKKEDVIDLNLMEPSLHIIPMMNLISEDIADVNLKEEKMIIKSGRQKSEFHFCSPFLIREFTGKPKELKISHTLKLDDDIFSDILKIKKISPKFKKVYFGSNKGVLFIETSDMTNRSSNKLNFELENTSCDDFVLCFNHISINNLISVMDKEYNDFRFEFCYVDEQKMGRLSAIKTDETEAYYLMSEKEE